MTLELFGLINFRHRIENQICDNLWSDKMYRVKEGTWQYIYTKACRQSLVHIEEPLIEEPSWE